ncbi:hypothetical protein LCGC14_2490810, partial [marine sediment metagenome]
NAVVTLDNRITELEAEMKQILNEFDEVETQRDELVEALLGFVLKTSHHTPSLSREWLQAIKIISTVKGKTWEEINQPGVAG